jgi:hypothetical protein
MLRMPLPHAGLKQKEANAHTAWLARTIAILHKLGKAFIFENQVPDGAYPKAWDHPALQAAIAETGALIIPTFMGEFGLAPPDDPTKSHRKACWVLVSANLAPWAVLLWCVESRNRDYVALQGNVPGTSLNRTQFAARYTPQFIQAILKVIQLAYAGDPPAPPRPSLCMGGVSQQAGKKSAGDCRNGQEHSMGRAEIEERLPDLAEDPPEEPPERLLHDREDHSESLPVSTSTPERREARGRVSTRSPARELARAYLDIVHSNPKFSVRIAKRAVEAERHWSFLQGPGRPP